jgi:hypothetical protein
MRCGGGDLSALHLLIRFIITSNQLVVQVLASPHACMVSATSQDIRMSIITIHLANIPSPSTRNSSKRSNNIRSIYLHRIAWRKKGENGIYCAKYWQQAECQFGACTGQVATDWLNWKSETSSTWKLWSLEMQVHRFGTERNTDTEEEEHAVLFWDRNSTSPKYMGHVKEEIWRPLYTSSCSCLRDRYRLWRWQRQLLLIHHPLPFADCRPQLFREGASNFSSKHACRGRVFPAFRYSQPFFLSLHDTIMPTLFPEVLQLFLPEFQCFGRMSSGTRHDQTLVFLQRH